jgi:hypothetical protein
MPQKSNKEIEKYYFEMFRRDYPLPIGSIDYGDKPDVILNGERKIGIEITNFFLEKGNLPESEQIQREAREKIVSEAQRIYQEGNGKNIELTFGFNKARAIGDQKKLVKNMVELAKGVEGWETGALLRENLEKIPELSYVYLNAQEYQDAKWRIAQLYTVPLMSTEGLRKIIKEKEEKSKEYRPCDAYWLLVVIDFADMAQDQEIQIDNFEEIVSDTFEKIIVYKTVFGHVLESK